MARDAFTRQVPTSNSDASDSDLPSIPGDDEVGDPQVLPIDVLGNSSQTTSQQKRKITASKKKKNPNSPKRRPQWRMDSLRALVHAGTGEKTVLKSKFKGVTGTRVQKRLAWDRVAGRLILKKSSAACVVLWFSHKGSVLSVGYWL